MIEGVFILNFIYQRTAKFFSSQSSDLPKGCSFSQQPVQSIRNLLLSDKKSFLVARIGAVETLAIYRYFKYQFINPSLRVMLSKNAGFYYQNRSQLIEFCDLNRTALMNADLIAHWDTAKQKKLFQTVGLKKELITLGSLEPFWPGANWLNLPNQTKVTVVSPFINTMVQQLPKMHLIHPSFDISRCLFSFVKAPMTNGSYDFSPGDLTWMQRIEIMVKAVIEQTPDLVLIGAGSYGLVLGELLRQAGLRVILVGGGLQLYFGVIGRRWLERPDYQAIHNEHWTHPSDKEKPRGYESIENGCYW